mgnify:CR=1 FL=1
MSQGSGIYACGDGQSDPNILALKANLSSRPVSRADSLIKLVLVSSGLI